MSRSEIVCHALELYTTHKHRQLTITGTRLWMGVSRPRRLTWEVQREEASVMGAARQAWARPAQAQHRRAAPSFRRQERAEATREHERKGSGCPRA
ncbi:hypothetical protein K523DRAFT_144821 [Schizophyllum commune Tattone D]|nr:hypothetical protein K523DRAFT_144821 [Schizophyllum commune Tattone D]